MAPIRGHLIEAIFHSFSQRSLSAHIFNPPAAEDSSKVGSNQFIWADAQSLLRTDGIDDVPAPLRPYHEVLTDDLVLVECEPELIMVADHPSNELLKFTEKFTCWLKAEHTRHTMACAFLKIPALNEFI